MIELVIIIVVCLVLIWYFTKINPAKPKGPVTATTKPVVPVTVIITPDVTPPIIAPKNQCDFGWMSNAIAQM